MLSNKLILNHTEVCPVIDHYKYLFNPVCFNEFLYGQQIPAISGNSDKKEPPLSLDGRSVISLKETPLFGSSLPFQAKAHFPSPKGKSIVNTIVDASTNALLNSDEGMFLHVLGDIFGKKPNWKEIIFQIRSLILKELLKLAYWMRNLVTKTRN